MQCAHMDMVITSPPFGTEAWLDDLMLETVRDATVVKSAVHSAHTDLRAQLDDQRSFRVAEPNTAVVAIKATTCGCGHCTDRPIPINSAMGRGAHLRFPE